LAELGEVLLATGESEGVHRQLAGPDAQHRAVARLPLGYGQRVQQQPYRAGAGVFGAAGLDVPDRPRGDTGALGELLLGEHHLGATDPDFPPVNLRHFSATAPGQLQAACRSL
jgi:hypothetical protein